MLIRQPNANYKCFNVRNVRGTRDKKKKKKIVHIMSNDHLRSLCGCLARADVLDEGWENFVLLTIYFHFQLVKTPDVVFIIAQLLCYQIVKRILFYRNGVSWLNFCLIWFLKIYNWWFLGEILSRGIQKKSPNSD